MRLAQPRRQPKSSTGSGGGGGGGALDKTQDETVQAMSDPLLVFLQCNEGVTVALAIGEQFKGPDDTEGLTEIKVSTMADTKCAVTAPVMKPSLSSSVESPSTLLFSPASFLGKVDVSGAAVQISNPELTHDSHGHVVFAATIEKPRELMDLSWASVSEETKTTIAKSNEACKVVNFPYTSSVEEPLFITMGTEGESPIGTTTAPRGVSNVPIVECPIGGCGQSWKASLMRHHMGCLAMEKKVSLKGRERKWAYPRTTQTTAPRGCFRLFRLFRLLRFRELADWGNSASYNSFNA